MNSRLVYNLYAFKVYTLLPCFKSAFADLSVTINSLYLDNVIHKRGAHIPHQPPLPPSNTTLSTTFSISIEMELPSNEARIQLALEALKKTLN